MKDLIAEILPNGNLLWKAVADEYQRRTGKSEPRDGQDIQKYWQFKMCNNYKKPTGSTGGAGKDFILECIGIACKIMEKSSAILLGGLPEGAGGGGRWQSFLLKQ